MLQVTSEHRFYHNGEWIEASSLKVGDLLHLKNGDYTCVMNIEIEVLPHYEKVYNFDIEDNENYSVTEDGILVHNRYKDISGEDFEDTIEEALKKENILYDRGRYILNNKGKKLGEIDFETSNYIIEATIGKNSKLSQRKKYFTKEFNPNSKKVVLVAPNYKNSNAIKDIKDIGADVVHSIDDLIKLIK